MLLKEKKGTSRREVALEAHKFNVCKSNNWIKGKTGKVF